MPGNPLPADGDVNLEAGAVKGRIAFSSGRILNVQKIFTMNGDGSGLVCLMCPGASDPSGTGSTIRLAAPRPLSLPTAIPLPSGVRPDLADEFRRHQPKIAGRDPRVRIESTMVSGPRR